MRTKYLYYAVPLILFLLQAIFTFNSFGNIRIEEVRASIKEVWWWQNRELFQSSNSMIGWYTALTALYSVFGFDLALPKLYRLGLSLISLFSLSLVLKEWLGKRGAFIPLLTIGLSPTLLFFNTLSAPYGVDLQYLPIIIFLLTRASKVPQAAGWLLSMFAWLNYPTFIFFLPALFWRFRPNLLSIFAFLLPLGLALIWVKEPLKMLYDPKLGRGLFTAGGGLIFESDNVIRTLIASFENLFVAPTAYYLELSLAEFSHILPLASFLFVLVTGILILRSKTKSRGVVLLVFLVMIFNLVTVAFTIDGGIPGGRRNTPFLAAFYVLFVLVWGYLNKFEARNPKSETNSNEVNSNDQKVSNLDHLNFGIVSNFDIRISNFRFFGVGLMSFLLVHHLIAYPVNLINLKNPSPFEESTWFSKQSEQNLNQMVNDLQKGDLYLDCAQFQEKGIFECSYGDIYAALAGSCKWNNLSCHNIYGNITGLGVIPLTISVFQSYNLEKE